MAGEGIQHYLDLMAGAGRATRARARAAARGLLAQAGLEDAADSAGERITKLTDEIQAASRANRELMLKLIGAEVEKVAEQLGFARQDDIDELRREVAELRVGLAHQVVRTEEAMAVAESLADDAMAEGLTPEPAPKPTAKKAAAKKAPAKTAKKPAAKKTPGTSASATTSATRKPTTP